MTEHIVTVTPELADRLIRAAADIDNLDRVGKSLKDMNHYATTARALERLALAILDASRPNALIGPEPTGARFEFGPKSDVARKLSEAVSYLQDQASALLSGDKLDRYSADHVTFALGLLKGLYGMVMYSVTAKAQDDLHALSKVSPALLLSAAANLSDRAAPSRS